MKDHKIYELRGRCYDCRECILGRRKVDELDPHVFANGHVNANVIFVAEAPGSNEVVQRRPLCGRSGKFYDDNILAPAGLERKKVYTTNTVLCRPNEKNRNPLPGEILACRPLLDAQICLVKPKLIVALGNIPLFGVCETTGITKRRGTLYWSREWSNEKRIPVLPLFHPAYCLRGSGLKEMKEDVEFLSTLVKDIKSSINWEVKEIIDDCRL